VTVTAARMLVALSVRHTGHLLYVNSIGSRQDLPTDHVRMRRLARPVHYHERETFPP
jgi:hypothetical protein